MDKEDNKKQDGNSFPQMFSALTIPVYFRRGVWWYRYKLEYNQNIIRIYYCVSHGVSLNWSLTRLYVKDEENDIYTRRPVKWRDKFLSRYLNNDLKYQLRKFNLENDLKYQQWKGSLPQRGATCDLDRMVRPR